jgi:hypothetical protein
MAILQRIARPHTRQLLLLLVLMMLHAATAATAPIFSMTSTSGGPAAATTTGGGAIPRRMASTGGRGMPTLGGVGFDKERTLGFVEYLSTDALESIDTFDRLSVGLNMTIENFFTFINRLLEEDVPGEEDEEEGADGAWGDEDTLSVKQLGQLFGGVNDTAVDYILDNLGADIYDLQAGFNTVDVIMVLMFVSSHLEANRLPLSILEIISAFCDPEWEDLDADVWVRNVAKSKGVKEKEVQRVMNQLEGSLEDIRGYVEEIVRMDCCELVLNGGFPTVVTAASSKASPRLTSPRLTSSVSIDKRSGY